MSYYRICPNCGKGTIGRYATDDSLCGECSSDTDELSAEKLQEQLNTAKKLLTELAYGECHTCGEEFEDNNCEFCSIAYPFCSQECYDNYMKNEGSGDE